MHSEGAEFLVLGHLLIRGIHATKAYTRFPGWDVLATDPTTGRTCRIQVKARLAADYGGGFPIKNFDAEFVAHVALNRGFRYHRARSRRDAGDKGVRDPEFYILPMHVVRSAIRPGATWGASSKVFLRDVPNCDGYLGAWSLIGDWLQGES